MIRLQKILLVVSVIVLVGCTAEPLESDSSSSSVSSSVASSSPVSSSVASSSPVITSSSRLSSSSASSTSSAAPVVDYGPAPMAASECVDAL